MLLLIVQTLRKSTFLGFDQISIPTVGSECLPRVRHGRWDRRLLKDVTADRELGMQRRNCVCIVWSTRKGRNSKSVSRDRTSHISIEDGIMYINGDLLLFPQSFFKSL